MINKKTVRGQMEIMGLVMVVILLIFGFLIYVRIQMSSSDRDVDTSQDKYMQDLSSKVLKIMLHTTSGCRYLDGRRLLSDVASNVKSVSSGNCEYNQGLLVSCGNDLNTQDVLFGNNGAEGFISDILNKTLGEAKINYELEIKMKGGCKIKSINSTIDCSKAKKSPLGEFEFQSDKGPVIISLRVC